MPGGRSCLTHHALPAPLSQLPPRIENAGGQPGVGLALLRGGARVVDILHVALLSVLPGGDSRGEGDSSLG